MVVEQEEEVYQFIGSQWHLKVYNIAIMISFFNKTSYRYYNIVPLLDDWQKGGNPQSPERAFLCNHFGICMYACLTVCDQATGHSCFNF